MLFSIWLMLFRMDKGSERGRKPGVEVGTKKENVIILIGIKSMRMQRKLAIRNEKNDFVEDMRFKVNF